MLKDWFTFLFHYISNFKEGKQDDDNEKQQQS